jgi:hypothetical protein
MRDLVAVRLRAGWPTARIIHELPLRYSSNRIDMAAITETEIIGVEIKSSKDVAARLEAQIRAFVPVTHLLWVCLAPKHNEELPDRVEEAVHPRYGTIKTTEPQYTPAQAAIERAGDRFIQAWTVDADSGESRRTRGGYLGPREYRVPWPAMMLDMLWNSELARAGAGDARHDVQVRRCAETMTGREAVRAVCAALRARDAFAAGSDPPIGTIQIRDKSEPAPPIGVLL